MRWGPYESPCLVVGSTRVFFVLRCADGDTTGFHASVTLVVRPVGESSLADIAHEFRRTLVQQRLPGLRFGQQREREVASYPAIDLELFHDSLEQGQGPPRALARRHIIFKRGLESYSISYAASKEEYSAGGDSAFEELLATLVLPRA